MKYKTIISKGGEKENVKYNSKDQLQRILQSTL